MVLSPETSQNKPRLYTCEHEKLGTIIGFERSCGAVQFRNIPYAQIPGRFRQSVLLDSLPIQPYLATQPGPRCPHPPQELFPYWDSPLPNELPSLERPRDDELNCLHLTLTLPIASMKHENRKIPVLVYIHGGGFTWGNSAAQVSGREVFDGANLVGQSIAINRDMIVVAINYRVGPLGFLASKQLASHNQTYGETVGNYGLHDQRRALEWLLKFISGFGGDPDNITIHGTSAGSVSCHFLSLFPVRMYKRAILASGTYLSVGALPLTNHQEKFDLLLQKIAPGMEDSQVLTTLLSCDLKDLTESLEWIICDLVFDGESITEETIKEAMSGLGQPDTIVGCTSFEEDFPGFVLMSQKNLDSTKTNEDIMRFARGVFSSNYLIRSSDMFPFDQPAVLESYNLSDNKEHSTQQRLGSLAHLLGNVLFDMPTLYAATTAWRDGATESQVWLYRLDATNTYAGNHSYGKAHHGLNDLLLFNVAPEQIPVEDQSSWNAAVENIQTAFIKFAAGESPWEPVRPNGSIQDVGKVGPVFSIADNGKSRIYDSVESCIGRELTVQYLSLAKNISSK